MGWLEVFTLLKRMLPLLDRLAPMLEATLAGRGAARAELERATSRADEAAKAHAVVLQRLSAQDAQLAEIAAELKRHADAGTAERLDRLESRVQHSQRTATLLGAACVVLLLGVLILLILLLRRTS